VNFDAGREKYRYLTEEFQKTPQRFGDPLSSAEQVFVRQLRSRESDRLSTSFDLEQAHQLFGDRADAAQRYSNYRVREALITDQIRNSRFGRDANFQADIGEVLVESTYAGPVARLITGKTVSGREDASRAGALVETVLPFAPQIVKPIVDRLPSNTITDTIDDLIGNSLPIRERRILPIVEKERPRPTIPSKPTRSTPLRTEESETKISGPRVTEPRERSLTIEVEDESKVLSTEREKLIGTLRARRTQLHDQIGERTARVGLAREKEVVRLEGEGARLAKDAKGQDIIERDKLGTVRVDVYGRDGALIIVGGKGKAGPLDDPQGFLDAKSELGDRLTNLKRIAEGKEGKGVPYRAYFVSDTSPELIEFAREKIGIDNVRFFEEPKIP
jgi:hypothetical protein